MLTIALAKGRTADDLWPLLDRAGVAIPQDVDESRALVFEVSSASAHAALSRDGTAENTDANTIRYLLAKPADVPTYVHFGVADMGVVGKDVLLESDSDIYELLDLEVARCALCVAGPPEERDKRPRRIATKYPKLAEQYFRSQGVAIDIVPLSGSIELAAVIGLTDRIFDLVQTGKTLAANGLEVFDRVRESSARLIANRGSYRLKRQQIESVAKSLEAAVQVERAAVRCQGPKVT
ncbi:ATP phosphoribosyltransferase [Alicyclobacillus sp. SO9]|uniref:ATP phosphoribosyltransferase n=1 Tax=Alicyclobacillus sp. SO9 TaxID=2665646 RepID=UPI0018E76305|nr:ATP phosphoribosyltransferase [Alicyclobacillus sp. SO9]QQE80198.1 ATP phosphoribosyltransferase [Alicyclobacillus sp. SO9]